MTKEEQLLLLTVARLLRVMVHDEVYVWQADDYYALNEALAPFDAIKSEPINETE